MVEWNWADPNDADDFESTKKRIIKKLYIKICYISQCNNAKATKNKLFDKHKLNASAI